MENARKNKRGTDRNPCLSVWPPTCFVSAGILNLGFREVAFLPHQAHPARGEHTCGIHGPRPSLSTLVQGIYDFNEQAGD